MTNDVEYLFICLFVISSSFLKKSMFKSFVHFKNRVVHSSFIQKSQKARQPKCPSADEWASKNVSIQWNIIHPYKENSIDEP